MSAIPTSETYRIWTKNLSSAVLNVDGVNNYFSDISVVLLSGTVTLSGNLTVAGVASDPLVLQSGQPITISTSGPAPLGGITIDASGGSCQIIAH